MIPVWTEFPPKEDEKRLENYARYRLMFKGDHAEVFSRVQAWIENEQDKAVLYIICNFAGLVSKVVADLLFGEQSRIVVGDSESKEQKAVDAILSGNNLHASLYEGALSGSFRGDSVFKVWYDGGEKGTMKSRIDAVPAQHYFPHLSQDNIRQVTGATIAYIVKQGEKEYLRKEIHLPGKIINELWLMDRGEIKDQVLLKTFDAYKDVLPEQETGYPGLLVEHIPNWRLDDEFFGNSDYIDMEGLFDELNNRLSKVSRILDKHSDPKLVLPPNTMKEDPITHRWYVEKEDLQCLEVDPNEAADLPRYVVWDASLDSAFKQLYKLLELLMMVSETSPAAFGLDKGGAAESGRALKFRLLRTLAKVNRKKMYWDNGIKNLLYAAQVLESNAGHGYTPSRPRIEWADGIPADPMEQSQIESARTAAGLTSVESAIRRLDGLTGKELTDEMARIDDERKSVAPVAPDVNDNAD